MIFIRIFAHNYFTLKLSIMSKESSSSGVSFVGLLTILFIALKLTNFIDWSWWWVLSPMWLTAVIFVFAVIVLVLIRKAIERL